MLVFLHIIRLKFYVSLTKYVVLTWQSDQRIHFLPSHLHLLCHFHYNFYNC